jgi:hypothetical protein
LNPIPVSLNDLPRYSPWPARLAGGAPLAARRRTREEVLREYDREKWGSVLAWLKSRPPGASVTADDLLRQQKLDPAQIIPFARKDQLFTAPAGAVMEAYDNLLLDTLRGHAEEALVELGCGLGDKLLKVAAALRPRVIYGGEFTGSGVECGRLLAAQRGVTARFEHFDYSEPQTLATVPKGALVYTSHSIEQIPHLPDSFIEGLIGRAPRRVVHFEPCYGDQDEETLLGLLRRSYTVINDYNRNLVEMLRSFEQAGRIHIHEHRKNVFSDTPFNPTSVLAWAPA